jgi:hypothetical protein
MENNPDQTIHSFQHTLALGPEAISHLEETRKWAFFLSIIGFIGIGLMLLLALFINTFLSAMKESMPMIFPIEFLSLLYVIIAAINFFPVLYLYRFSIKMKAAVHQNDQQSLNDSLKNMKLLFRFIGFITAMILSLYLIVIVTAIVVGVVRSF